MDSTQLMITVLGIAVIGGSALSYRWFLNKRSEDREVTAEVQKLVALSEQETKRLDLVTRALAHQPQHRPPHKPAIERAFFQLGNRGSP